MSNYPDTLKYTKTHEWVELRDGATARIGITHHAQEELRDVVFIELPTVGDAVKQASPCAVIESVKAAFDFYAPVSGEVTAVNEAVESDPVIVNSDPQGAGWFCEVKLSDKGEYDALMSAEAYERFLNTGE